MGAALAAVRALPGKRFAVLAVPLLIVALVGATVVTTWGESPAPAALSPSTSSAAPAPETAAPQQAAQPAPEPPAVNVAPPLPPPGPQLADFLKEACSSNLSGTKPHVAQVGNFLKNMFKVKDVGGARGRAGGGDDHSIGLALDFMMPNPAVGTALAEFVLAHRKELGVTYVIWQQRYNDGGGWSMMEDRGSPTQNHYDHVHVSFSPSAKVNVKC